MPYQMNDILMKCDIADFKFIASQLDSYINFSRDDKIRDLIHAYEKSPESLEAKRSLCRGIEYEIRYAGSSDVAFAFRKLTSKDIPGVDVNEIIDDVAKALKIKIKVGSIEGRLERLTVAVVEKEFRKQTPERQREILINAGLEKAAADQFIATFKNNKVRVLPVILSVCGPEVTLALIQAIAIAALAAFIGVQAAKALIGALLKRFPFISTILGPVVWVASIGWMAIDIQGGALRKTIPIMVYLGTVCLRDGLEKGNSDLLNEIAEEDVD